MLDFIGLKGLILLLIIVVSGLGVLIVIALLDVWENVRRAVDNLKVISAQIAGLEKLLGNLYEFVRNKD